MKQFFAIEVLRNSKWNGNEVRVCTLIFRLVVNELEDKDGSLLEPLLSVGHWLQVPPPSSLLVRKTSSEICIFFFSLLILHFLSVRLQSARPPAAPPEPTTGPGASAAAAFNHGLSFHYAVSSTA